MLSFPLTSLIRFNEKSPINKKIKASYHFWGRNNNTRNKILWRRRNDSGANGKVGATTQGRTGKWAKRPGGETTRAKGKVGETTQGRTGKWAKRPGFIISWVGSIIQDKHEVYRLFLSNKWHGFANIKEIISLTNVWYEPQSFHPERARVPNINDN